MKKDIERIIEIPDTVQANIDGAKVVLKKDGKEVTRLFELPNVSIEKKGNQIILSAKKATKRELRVIGTAEAHIKNMIKGLGEDFVYHLEVCNVHFPMNVKVEGAKLVIKSFLGETVDRHANILKNVKVEVKGNQITVSSHEREAAGQTAANIEKATKLRGRDRRIFQDGIFMTEKCGRKI